MYSVAFFWVKKKRKRKKLDDVTTSKLMSIVLRIRGYVQEYNFGQIVEENSKTVRSLKGSGLRRPLCHGRDDYSVTVECFER
ncbi:hypothetical protein POVCU1_000790 [Plasmodium ovale curtisi]|uniref:Uncharacterized protein n=1 Tax=Plasmodium ovale curtisi TaxID=864141 RepID=A0A1A8VMB7_PLAOA|nr:hypothetical protein POVCU1_000790 [Plasmodium ovale curtisi]